MALSVKTKRAVLLVTNVLKKTAELKLKRQAKQKQKIEAVRAQHAKTLEAAESRVIEVLQPFFTRQIKTAVLKMQEKGEKFFQELGYKVSSCGAGEPGAPGFAPGNTCHGGGGSSGGSGESEPQKPAGGGSENLDSAAVSTGLTKLKKVAKGGWVSSDKIFSGYEEQEYAVAGQEFQTNGSDKTLNLKVAKLWATQNGVESDRVASFIKDPGLDKGEDTPRIYRFQSRLYVHDGHHRIAAALLRGDSGIKVRYLEDEMSPGSANLSTAFKSTFTETKDFVGRYLEQHRSAETKPLKASRYFNPRDWDEELIDRVLPTLAQIFGEEMIAELKRNGVDVKKLRNKCQQIYFEKASSCGAGSPGAPGFAPHNTCHSGGSSAGGSSSKIEKWAENKFGDKNKAKAFSAWFGESKVVDADGNPQVMYHGTTANFQEFNTDHGKESKNPGWAGALGSWFASVSDSASGFTEDGAGDFKPGSSVMPVYLAIKNPKVYTNYYKFKDDMTYDDAGVVAWKNKLMKEGYDGVLIKDSTSDFLGKRDDWVAFSPTQIKSAVGNQGSFDPNDPNITKSTQTKASTATEWLQQTGDSIANDWSFETPSGLVSMDFMTEYPDWMKESIRDNLNETFSQDYWTKVNDTTLGDIDGFLQQGARDGWSIDNIAKEISTQLTEEGKYGLRRGRLIARTELGNALNGARSSSMDALIDEVGDELPMKKQWLSVLGTTTRDTHAHLDGVPADKNNQWTLGGVKCRWPSDVTLPVGERVNCQCSIILAFGMQDEDAQELINSYTERIATKKSVSSCGAGAPGSPGFAPGNTCHGGGGSSGGFAGSGGSSPESRQGKMSTIVGETAKDRIERSFLVYPDGKTSPIVKGAGEGADAEVDHYDDPLRLIAGSNLESIHTHPITQEEADTAGHGYTGFSTGDLAGFHQYPGINKITAIDLDGQYYTLKRKGSDQDSLKQLWKRNRDILDEVHTRNLDKYLDGKITLAEAKILKRSEPLEVIKRLEAEGLVEYTTGKIKLTEKSTYTDTKVFCATGEGGGIDPTCKPAGGRNRTKLQNDAINAYTGSGKNTFGLEEKDRNSLNSMQDGIPINKLTPKAKKVVLALLSAVEVHQEPKTVYRGIFEFNSRSSKFLEQLENSVGGEIKLTGFHSTSTDPTIAASDFSNGTVLKIKQLKGIVVETSNFAQSEIIAPPTSYRVVSKSIETFRESYTEKKIKRQVYHLEELPSAEEKSTYTDTKVFCPTGPGGGIDPTCGKGKLGYGGTAYTAPEILLNGELVVSSVGKFAGVDTSILKQGTKVGLYCTKKIAELEKLAHDGDWNAFQKKMLSPKKISPYQALIIEAQGNLLALKNKQSTELPKEATPSTTNPAVATDAGWKKIGPQLGTEKGGKYELGGKEYYVKQPDDSARAHNEVLSAKLYELAGGNVVKTQLVEIDGKTAYAAEWEVSTKADWNSPSTKAMAAEDFAIHAWLNNRDAVGAGSENPMDNIRISKSGTPILVDAGGALDYSGMGGSGKKPFTLSADEWHTLRDPKINPTMAKVFGGMTPQQLIDSAKKLEAIKPEDIAELVNKFSDKTTAEKNKLIFTLKARRDDILASAKHLADKMNAPTPPATDVDAKLVAAGFKPLDTPPSAGSIPPALPAPFKIIGKSLAYMQPKVDAIAAAAAAGDIKAVEKVKIKEGASNPHYQKIEQYKNSVLAAMKGGSTASPTTAKITPEKSPAPAPAPVKIDSSKFPDEPSFITKNPGMVAANKDLVSKIKKLAESGDLNSLSATVTTGFIAGTQIMSPKVKAYAQQLHAEVASQLAPPPAAPKKLSESFQELSAKVGNPKTATALQKIGYWNVLADLDGVPDIANAGAFVKYQPELQKKGHSAAKKSGGLTAIKEYTGGGYHDINHQLRNNGASEVTTAYKAATAVTKHGIEIAKGTLLSRKHSLSNEELAKLKPGQVVSDKGLLSTSTDDNVWNGNVHWKMSVGEGVKGMPVEEFTKSTGEQEVILPPNQRILITGITKKNSYTTEIHAVILPTLENQCCPP